MAGHVFDLPSTSLSNNFQKLNSLTKKDSLAITKLKSFYSGTVIFQNKNDRCTGFSILNLETLFNVPLFYDPNLKNFCYITSSRTLYYFLLDQFNKGYSNVIAKRPYSDCILPTGGSVYFSSWTNSTLVNSANVIIRNQEVSNLTQTFIYIPKETHEVLKPASLIKIENCTVLTTPDITIVGGFKTKFKGFFIYREAAKNLLIKS